MNIYFIDLIAGSLSGILSVIAGHPFDTIKCRMQLSPVEYKNVSVSLLKIIKEEKIRGFYKGVLPPIISNFPLNAM